MRARLLLAVALAGAAAGLAAGARAASPIPAPPAHAGEPVFPSGSVIGQGLPLKAYASIAPTVHLFGDTISARLAIVADRKWVDAARVRVRAAFKPYVAVGSPTLLQHRVGRFEQLTWTWTLRCVTESCVPVKPPSEKYHVFRFHPVHVDYLRPGGSRAYGITAGWPPIQVESQISPGVAAALGLNGKYNWRYALTPVTPPTYRVSPMLLVWLALGLAVALLLGATAAARRWYATVRPRPVVAAVPAGSPLERALALLAWAHEHGDETLQRKAFERVAAELFDGPAPAMEELSHTARELAWSPRVPADEEIETFSEQARETGKQVEPVEAAE